MSVLPPSDRKADYVSDMFAGIAGRYDLMNRLMTIGQDVRWRQMLVHAAALPKGGYLLDIATGTGDIGIEALSMVPDVRVVAADFSLPMMEAGRFKDETGRLAWLGADTLHLPFENDTFDAVSSGFLLRNLVDVVQALAEQRRVVRPGGHVVCLETSPPPGNWLRPFIQFHLSWAIPTLGKLISNSSDAYAYLPQSSLAFMAPDVLAEAFRAAGLREVRYRRLMFGTVAIHIGVK
ncbi:MAG: ubiquinone/menaquinone biosynthesis methyltransferase [Chloroflexota bacterium]|nr:ubiquinone/menaquinone biosynthesis methyltransferase [Chloroflexota bacterium]